MSATAPGFLATDFAEVCRHYQLIAGATDQPFLIYSWGQDVNPEKDARFFDIPNVKGMKYTGRNLPVIQELKAKVGKETVFFSGCDPMLVCALALAVNAKLSARLKEQNNLKALLCGHLH